MPRMTDPARDARPRVSVVIPTRNVDRTLEGCLASIRRQRYDDLEIIVVDNSSTDRTIEIARRLADLTVTAGPERSAQRNEGIRLSSGEYVLWIDADMLLDEEVVSAAVESAEDRRADAVFIPEASVGEGFWSRCRALERECYVGEPMIEAPRLVRREVFARAGGFRPDVTGQEDAELRMRLLSADAVLARSNVRILHDEGHMTLRGVLRKRYYYGRSLPAYAAAQPGAIRLQTISTVRALGRGWRLLLPHPDLAIGILVLRLSEACAYALGAARALSARRSRVGQGVSARTDDHSR